MVVASRSSSFACCCSSVGGRPDDDDFNDARFVCAFFLSNRIRDYLTMKWMCAFCCSESSPTQQTRLCVGDGGGAPQLESDDDDVK